MAAGKDRARGREAAPVLPELSLGAAGSAALLCALFGANTVAIKIMLTGMGTFTAAGIRFSLAAGVIVLWALASHRPFRIQPRQYGSLALLSLIFTAQLSLFYLGMSKTTASRGALMANLQPFFTLFLAHFLIPGDRITWRKSVGLLMAFGGVASVLLERGGAGGQLRLGDAIILAAALIWAGNGIYVKRILSAFHPFQLVLYPMLAAVPVFFLEAYLFDQTMVRHLNPPVLWALAYQAGVTASFGFIAWTAMLGKYGAVAMHSFIFIMPISGVLLGHLLLGDPVTPKILTALLLIGGGLLLIHLRPPRQRPLLSLFRG
jgi:drug/metabolite transporter (DMT)-like permease